MLRVLLMSIKRKSFAFVYIDVHYMICYDARHIHQRKTLTLKATLYMQPSSALRNHAHVVVVVVVGSYKSLFIITTLLERKVKCL